MHEVGCTVRDMCHELARTGANEEGSSHADTNYYVNGRFNKISANTPGLVIGQIRLSSSVYDSTAPEHTFIDGIRFSVGRNTIVIVVIINLSWPNFNI